VSGINAEPLWIIGTTHLHTTLRGGRILAPGLGMLSGDLHRGYHYRKEQRAISVVNGGFHTGMRRNQRVRDDGNSEYLSASTDGDRRNYGTLECPGLWGYVWDGDSM
jgi:hypothetical protein